MRVGETYRDEIRAAIEASEAAHKAEGRIFERVRLYEAATKDIALWRRARYNAVHRVLDEARDHECAAREHTLLAERVALDLVNDVLREYDDALQALTRIAANGADPCEIAAQAIDRARASMARYAEESETPQIELRLNAEPLKQALDAARERARMFDTRGTPIFAGGALDRDGVKIEERSSHGQEGVDVD
jgi:hypothetical protein